jgi:hypothetical protein
VNGQKKRTNNDVRQSTSQKTKYRTTRTPLKADGPQKDQQFQKGPIYTTLRKTFGYVFFNDLSFDYNKWCNREKEEIALITNIEQFYNIDMGAGRFVIWSFHT